MTVLNAIFIPTIALFLLQKKSLGHELSERVFCELDIVEKDYFGLQYIDHNNVQVSPAISIFIF